MKRYTLTESVRLHPISSCTSDKIGNSELRDILKEYYGNNEISYTADFDSEIWSEVLSYLDKNCKLIKDIELSSGIVTNVSSTNSKQSELCVNSSCNIDTRLLRKATICSNCTQ